MATFPFFLLLRFLLNLPGIQPLSSQLRSRLADISSGAADELRPLLDVDLLVLGESNSSATSPTFTWFSAATPG